MSSRCPQGGGAWATSHLKQLQGQGTFRTGAGKLFLMAGCSTDTWPRWEPTVPRRGHVVQDLQTPAVLPP